ncbi:hypothetical protein [Streptomyces sp. NPDC056527]|uniref:hypothetical protein n=1 Tax=Streptomyces sp. NPDC056527 TaxID=3345853 RepID=UPI0036C1C4C5
MSKLTPTPASPGLHVVKPSPSVPAVGSYACGCGQTGSATGDDNVRGLVDDYTAHKQAHSQEGK